MGGNKKKKKTTLDCEGTINAGCGKSLVEPPLLLGNLIEAVKNLIYIFSSCHASRVTFLMPSSTPSLSSSSSLFGNNKYE